MMRAKTWRSVLVAPVLATSGLYLSASTSAQLASSASPNPAFPDRALTIVVPFPAGGGSDVVARILASAMSARLGQPVVVENRSGAGGNIGAEAVARAKPDGHTLLFASMGVMSINPHLYPDMPFSPLRDFSIVGRIYDTPHLIVARPDFPATSLGDLVSLTRSKPGEFTFASGGNGTSTHLAGALFMDQTRSNLVHVPYKGNGPALNDTMAGHVDLMFDQATNSTAQVRAQRLRALATTAQDRLADLPDIPTVDELGFPGLAMTSWTVLAAPAGTPAEIMTTLDETLQAALADMQIQRRIQQTGGIPNHQGNEAATRFVQQETRRWEILIKRTNIAASQ